MATAVPLSAITMGSERRSLRGLDELMASIQDVGLLNPITITEQHRLIAGLHRLEACRRLGWTEIPATILPLSDLAAQLAEIDENLIRNDLTVLERGEHLKRRKPIYESLHPETRSVRERGGPGRGHRTGENERNHFAGFTDDVATKTGQTARTIQQEVQIATAIAPDVRASIHETALADSKTDLLAIARLKEPEQQRQAVAQVQQGKSVQDAVRAVRREAAASALRPTPLTTAALPARIVQADACQPWPQPDASVDLILTSPPYGLDKPYHNTQDLAAGWEEFMADWLAEAYRVAKTGGRLALNVPLDTTRGGKRPCYAQAVQAACDAGWTYAWTIVWAEGNVSKSVARGSVDSPAAPHVIAPVEMIAVFSKGEWARAGTQPPDIGHDEWLAWTNGLWVFGGEGRPWESHPAAFPEELPRRLILLLTFPGDTVLDPFLGSGTTALVAWRLKRQAVGFDLSSEYVESAQRRLTTAMEHEHVG